MLVPGSYDQHRPLDPDTQQWLFAKHEAWCAELERIEDEREREHGWECDCAGCYYARLELEFRYGPE